MKNPNWKQATPTDQLIAIQMSMEGHLSNLESRIIDNEKYINYQKTLIEQLHELAPFLRGDYQW